MKYLSLTERILSKEAGASWSGDYTYWIDYEPGAYVVESVTGIEIVIWDGSCAFTIPVNPAYIGNTAPSMLKNSSVESMLGRILDKLEEVNTNKTSNSTGIDGDILLKVLAVAQNSDLIKDLV